MSEKVIRLTPKGIEKAKEILAGLPDEQVGNIVKYLTETFLEEIHLGLEGEVEYKDAPFYELVDRIYQEHEVKGCYFCDRSIDGNAVPFNYPDKTEICLTCQIKVANLLKAFKINPAVLFPGMGDRKIQAVIYEREDTMHTKDSDCTVGETGACVICHVTHGDPCPECGGRAFHKDGCPIVVGTKH